MTHPIARALLLAGALATSACATTVGASRPAAGAPPNLAAWPGAPAPARGKLYADCLAQAIATGRYDRVDDRGGHLLRFRCGAAPAAALFDELGPWSAARRSEWRSGERVFRSTAAVVHDLFGVDYCSSDGRTAECALSLNVGDFLGPAPTP